MTTIVEGYAGTMRLDAGGVTEEVDVPGAGRVAVRYERCVAGWSAAFTIRLPDVNDLGVVHRLVAPTLHDARQAVPAAVSFLLGHPVDAPLLRN